MNRENCALKLVDEIILETENLQEFFEKPSSETEKHNDSKVYINITLSITLRSDV